MRLRWWRRPTMPSEGEKARKAAERDLARTRAQTPYFRKLAHDLREIRERNHLAEAFQYAASRKGDR